MKEQAINKRNTRKGTAFGITAAYLTLFQKFGKVSYGCFNGRMERGWDIEQALTVPSNLKFNWRLNK